MFDFNRKTGLFEAVHQVISPNCSERPAERVVDLLVLHSISLPPGEFGNGSIEAFFTNQLDPNQHPYFQTIQDLRVSAHFLIDRAGDVIQFVPLNKQAWHAGQSVFNGVEACNEFSIGIELEGTDDLPYCLEQYEVLIKLILSIQQHYPSITSDRIVGHSDIAPGRKTDPGSAFNWARLRRGLSRSFERNRDSHET